MATVSTQRPLVSAKPIHPRGFVRRLRKTQFGMVLRYIRRNYPLFVIPLAILLTGTLGYHFIERCNLLDSLYMTVITVATVGYREVVDLSPAGKVFTMLLIVVGFGTMLVAAVRLAEDAFAAAALRYRMRMDKQIARLSGHFIICGYGRMGRVVAEHLDTARTPYVIVERSSDDATAERESGHLVVEGDARDDAVLERAGIRNARGLVAVLASDADNVFVVLSARQFNPQLVILARAFSEESMPKLIQAGATKVINPYESAGARIAHALLKPVAGDFLEVFSTERGIQISIEEVVVQPKAEIAGKSLRESEIRRRTNAIIVAVKKTDGQMRFNPSGDEVLDPGDVLVAIADAESLLALAGMAR